MPATKRKPDQSASEARRARAASQLASIRAATVAKWREWAKSICEGQPMPDAVEVMAAGAILGIETPIDQLAQDADALEEFNQANRNAESCRKAVADKLVEFGGRPEAIDEAIAKHEKELARLRDIRSDVSNGCSESFWTTRMSDLRRGTPIALGHDA
jgi:hypothetical protein